MLVASCMLYASGWHIGGEAGYALNFLSTKTVWPNTYYRPGHGFEASFIAEYDINDSLSLSTGLRYIEKSFIYHHENSGITYAGYMEMDHFLELPLSIRYSYSFGDLSVFIGAGGYIGIWFLAQSFGMNFSASETPDNTLIENSNGDIMELTDSDNLFEAGLLAETGVSWTVADDIRLDFTLRYEGNLTSLVRNYQDNAVHRYNDTLSFSAGCLVPIGGKR